MNIIKIILGIIIGSLFTTFAAVICLTVAAYLTNNQDKLSIGLFLISAIYIVFYALITGGVSGGVVIGFNFDIFRAVMFGFFYSLLIGGYLIFLSGGGLEDEVYYVYYASIVIGGINGAIVSLINLWQKTPE